MARSGFTLIEISIVLVIIGLLVGGILVGRDLIHQAELKSALRQLQSFDAAIMAFKTKFNCLPGDCPQAADFGLSDAACPAVPTPCDPNGDIANAGCNGNNDGHLDSPYCPEALSFWNHLSRAGFLAGTYDGKTLSAGTGAARGAVFGMSAPRTPIRGVGVHAMYANATAGTADYYVLGIGYPVTSPNSFPFLSSAEAYYIDDKLDDGLPDSGRVRKTYLCYLGPLGSPYDLQMKECIITIRIPGYGG